MVLNAVKNSVMLDLDDTNTGKVCVFDPSQQSVRCIMTKVESSNSLDVLDEVRP